MNGNAWGSGLVRTHEDARRASGPSRRRRRLIAGAAGLTVAFVATVLVAAPTEAVSLPRTGVAAAGRETSVDAADRALTGWLAGERALGVEVHPRPGLVVPV